MLNDRKKKILQAIVEDYIDNVQPVGSKTLVENYNLGVSPATIRNEMAELEEMGYLDKTHISSGRVPSTLGYRFYVDSLLQTSNLNVEEINLLKNNIENEILEVSQIVKHISKTVSDITNYTVVSTGPNIKDAVIDDIKLVLLNNNMLLIIVLTKETAIKQTIIQLDEDVSEEVISKLNNLLRAKLNGIYVKDIEKDAIKYVNNELSNYLRILIPILKEITNILDNAEVVFDGANNIYKHPEFNSPDLAKNFLDTLEEKQIMLQALNVEDDDIKIYIGDENYSPEFKDLSLVTFKCPQNLGIVGIIGPTRMDYAKVISVVKYIKEILDNRYKGGYIGE
ncbi:MAG: heat-inducible transcription repressor HrcA [Clostridiales bacterium]|nr:heat-inducible transcription repressor HrcA [Clostridiales bacterium]